MLLQTAKPCLQSLKAFVPSGTAGVLGCVCRPWLLLQEEQKKMAADKAVIPEDQKEAQKAGNKPTVVSKDGDTIYLGFDKG